MLTDRLKTNQEMCALTAFRAMNLPTPKAQPPTMTNALKAYGSGKIEIQLFECLLVIKHHLLWFNSCYLVDSEYITEYSTKAENYSLDWGWCRIYRWLKNYAN